jgi:hypothetical protein
MQSHSSLRIACRRSGPPWAPGGSAKPFKSAVPFLASASGPSNATNVTVDFPPAAGSSTAVVARAAGATLAAFLACSCFRRSLFHSVVRSLPAAWKGRRPRKLCLRLLALRSPQRALEPALCAVAVYLDYDSSDPEFGNRGSSLGSIINGAAIYVPEGTSAKWHKGLCRHRNLPSVPWQSLVTTAAATQWSCLTTLWGSDLHLEARPLLLGVHVFQGLHLFSCK